MHIYNNMGQVNLLMQLPSPSIYKWPTASAFLRQTIIPYNGATTVVLENPYILIDSQHCNGFNGHHS